MGKIICQLQKIRTGKLNKSQKIELQKKILHFINNSIQFRPMDK